MWGPACREECKQRAALNIIRVFAFLPRPQMPPPCETENGKSTSLYFHWGDSHSPRQLQTPEGTSLQLLAN